MRDLPQNWCTSKLGELIEFKYGKALPDRVRSGSGFPVYGSNGIVGYHNDALTSGITIIIGRKGSVGEIHYSDIPCSPIDTTYYIDNFPENLPRYWFYQLKTLKLSDLNKATAIPGLNRMDAYNQDIVLAPLNEQKRIADKLDAILARVDACRERLDRIPAILKRFRQAVLAAATSGKLTEDWQEDNQFFLDWPEVRLADVANSRLGKMLDRNKNQGEPTPYLRNINVRWFGFDLDNIQEIPVSSKERNELSLRIGDVLICEGGEPGRCAVWQEKSSNFVYQKALHRVRVGNKLLPVYLCYVIKAATDNQSLSELFTGTTIKHLTGVSLSRFSFLLPSIEEQTEIVRRVESLLAYADRLEARYATIRAKVDKLTPAILAKAFRGELVPQDPDDEPASVLLERIRKAVPAAKQRGRSKTNPAAGI